MPGPTAELDTLTVTIDAWILHVGYPPEKLDTHVRQQLQSAAAASTNEQQCQQTAEILAILMVTWSLLDDGQPVPLALETIQRLPGRVLGALSSSFRIQWVTNEVKRLEREGGRGWRTAARALLAEAAQTNMFGAGPGKGPIHTTD